MKKTGTFLATALVFALMITPAFAGSCGSGGKAHTHAEQAKAKYDKNKMDIVETAISAESFSTLVAAVKAAGLVETLKGEGPFTVFAPTDEAFAALGEETIASLLEDKEKLTAILTYHVAPMKLPAKQVLQAKGIETVNGQTASISKVDGKPMIDKANIIKTDIMASNGVIHVIDRVILPSDDSEMGTRDKHSKDSYSKKN
jgi:uncharacterized surface protein with fasciclin (FAS1) repeats